MKYGVAITLLAINSVCIAQPSVDQKIENSISIGNAKIVGDAPEIAMSNLYTQASQQFDSPQTGEILQSSNPAGLMKEYIANDDLAANGVVGTPDYQ